MMARRYRSLHHNLRDGENVVFHREHRSPRNRSFDKIEKLDDFERRSRRKFKNFAKSREFFAPSTQNWGKRRKF